MEKQTALSAGRDLAGRSPAWALMTACLLAAGAPAGAAPGRPRVFIVSCRCAAVADRTRIAAAVRRMGGQVVYTYDAMPGMAVASPPGDGADRFEKWLRRLPAVTDVHLSEARQLQSGGD